MLHIPTNFLPARAARHTDARFAGVDTKLAAIREVQALHTTRFTTIEQKLNQIAAAVAEILRRLTEQS